MDRIIEYMLEEDEGFGDITSEAVVDEDKTVTAHIISKDEGILAGIDIIKEMFESKNVQVIFFTSSSSVASETEGSTPT